MSRHTKITMSQCERFFHLPVEEAAAKLGVSRPTISRVMRMNGYKRWPYRRINAMIKRTGRVDLPDPSFNAADAPASALALLARRGAAAGLPNPPPRRSQQIPRSEGGHANRNAPPRANDHTTTTTKLLDSLAPSTSDESMGDCERTADNNDTDLLFLGDEPKPWLRDTPTTSGRKRAPPKIRSRRMAIAEDEITTSDCTKAATTSSASPRLFPSPPTSSPTKNGVELLALVCENAPARLQGANAAPTDSDTEDEDEEEEEVVVRRVEGGEIEEDIIIASVRNTNTIKGASKIRFQSSSASSSSCAADEGDTTGTIITTVTKARFLESFIRAAASLGRVRFTVHGDTKKVGVIGEFGRHLRLIKGRPACYLSVADQSSNNNNTSSVVARINLDRAHYIDLVETRTPNNLPTRFVRILQDDLAIVVAAALLSDDRSVADAFKDLRDNYGGILQLPFE